MAGIAAQLAEANPRRVAPRLDATPADRAPATARAGRRRRPGAGALSHAARGEPSDARPAVSSCRRGDRRYRSRAGVLLWSRHRHAGWRDGRDRRDRIGRRGSAERLLEDREGYARCRTESREEMAAVGVVAGSVESRALPKLRQVDGVAQNKAGRTTSRRRTTTCIGRRNHHGIRAPRNLANIRTLVAIPHAIDRRPGAHQVDAGVAAGDLGRDDPGRRGPASSRGGPGRCCSRGWRSASGRGSAACGVTGRRQNGRTSPSASRHFAAAGTGR